jgi:hypothetical protein
VLLLLLSVKFADTLVHEPLRPGFAAYYNLQSTAAATACGVHRLQLLLLHEAGTLPAHLLQLALASRAGPGLR